MVTLEAILEGENLRRAYAQVVANKGSAGVDGMEVSQLADYFAENPYALTEALKQGKYKPQAVLRVLIPKEEKGKMRPLGIPTVIDRFVQQAVAQVVSQDYEEVFSDNSHGFRPNRGCHTAIEQCLKLANEGYEWVVDLDLAKFFDTVNHSKLLQVLSERIKDGRVISLIHKFLRAPVREGKKETVNSLGTPQGGCISPVLANVLLNELDHKLEERKHQFVRYADDMMIFCKSERAALRTLETIRPYIEGKLFLKINEQKTKVCRITDPNLKFLGYGFYKQTYRDGTPPKIKGRPHEKSKIKFKQKLKLVTRRNRGQSLDAYRRQLAPIVRGWVNYFKLGAMKMFLQRTSEWLRRRIRQIYWKQWKKVSMRYRALMKLGLSKQKAWEYANTRKAYWRIANSWILHTTLKKDFLDRMGWICPDSYYAKCCQDV